MPLPPKDMFLKSLNRCLKDESFIEKFYVRFLGSSEEVAEKFKYTDFERQHRMLAHSLQMAAHAVEGDHDALHHLTEQANLHNRENLDIRPELYHFWLDAIMACAEETDPFWDKSVRESWDIVLEHVIHHMTSRY